jgi:KipI family sensor histidine kinase inhibitor
MDADHAAAQVVPFGDQALLAVLGDEIEPGLNARVHALAAAVQLERDRTDAPWGVPVPAYASLLVPYDVRRLSLASAIGRLEALLRAATPNDGGPGLAAAAEHLPALAAERLPALEVPVRYGGTDGPDLAEVARRTGLTEERVVELHAGVVYRVYMLGFSPGFAYLGTLPDELALPRRDEPRTRVPKGSVAIAARQTAIYPSATPGGWHLIGRTDAPVWDITSDPPALLQPGRSVRFVPQRA